MLEHAGGSLVFEPMEQACQPRRGQSASRCLHGLPDLIDVFGGMGKVQDAHGIRTVIVHQPLQPLRSILHCTHLCCPFQPSSMRFHQCCLRKALGLTEARKRGNLLRADLPALVAGDLPHHDCLDFRPLAPHQVHHRSIRTQHLLVCSTRCLGHLLLEALHLPSHTASAASPVVSVARRAVALLTWIPTRSWSSSRACSNGIQLANRTSVSSPRGVNPPLTSPNSSSRGKKASPTGRAGAIRARQLDCFPSHRLDEACLLSAGQQRLATRRTLRPFLLRL